MVGVPRSKFAEWIKRYGKANEHNALVPRDHWVTTEERTKIVAFHAQNPLEGYRRLTFMMLDRDVVAVSPTTTWRVLSAAGLLDRWNRMRAAARIWTNAAASRRFFPTASASMAAVTKALSSSEIVPPSARSTVTRPSYPASRRSAAASPGALNYKDFSPSSLSETRRLMAAAPPLPAHSAEVCWAWTLWRRRQREAALPQPLPTARG